VGISNKLSVRISPQQLLHGLCAHKLPKVARKTHEATFPEGFERFFARASKVHRLQRAIQAKTK
jgi:NAD-specific glutamate dehydrogenase